MNRKSIAVTVIALALAAALAACGPNYRATRRMEAPYSAVTTAPRTVAPVVTAAPRTTTPRTTTPVMPRVQNPGVNNNVPSMPRTPIVTAAPRNNTMTLPRIQTPYSTTVPRANMPRYDRGTALPRTTTPGGTGSAVRDSLELNRDSDFRTAQYTR